MQETMSETHRQPPSGPRSGRDFSRGDGSKAPAFRGGKGRGRGGKSSGQRKYNDRDNSKGRLGNGKRSDDFRDLREDRNFSSVARNSQQMHTQRDNYANAPRNMDFERGEGNSRDFSDTSRQRDNGGREQNRNYRDDYDHRDYRGYGESRDNRGTKDNRGPRANENKGPRDSRDRRNDAPRGGPRGGQRGGPRGGRDGPRDNSKDGPMDGPRDGEYRDARDLNRNPKGRRVDNNNVNGFRDPKKGRPKGIPSGPRGAADKSDGFSSREAQDNSKWGAGYELKGVKRPLPSEPRGFRKKRDTAEGKTISKTERDVKIKPLQVYSIKTQRKGDAYRTVQQVGEGTYGKVYKALNTFTNEHIAMKRLRLETEREGFPITALREIKLLQSFHHPNVVGLLEMMVDRNQIYMIFDYMDHDLTGLLTHPDLKLEEQHCKYLFKQLMEGLNYLHKRRIIHRDIKGSNILVDYMGRLKIADFGLARPMKILKDGESPDYTNRVITIWYRPPELLLGATDYGREVDIWGVGCLLMELYQKHAIFQGFDEIGQLTKIFNVMGTPGITDWPEIDNLPWFEMLKPKVNLSNRFRKMYASLMSPSGFDLAEKLLCMNPNKRLTAHQALEHSYFTEHPKPAPLTFLKDVKGEWHEFETKKRRRMERKQREQKAKEQKEERERKGVKEVDQKESLRLVDTEREQNDFLRNDMVETERDHRTFSQSDLMEKEQHHTKLTDDLVAPRSEQEVSQKVAETNRDQEPTRDDPMEIEKDQKVEIEKNAIETERNQDQLTQMEIEKDQKQVAQNDATETEIDQKQMAQNDATETEIDQKQMAQNDAAETEIDQTQVA